MLTIDDKEIIGRGGMSTVYKLNDTLAVKVFRQGITFVDALHEYDMSHLAYDLGMPTPKPHEILRISQPTKALLHTQVEEQTDSYGIIYDLINGETLSEAITTHPDRLSDYALQMSQLYQQLHTTKVNSSSLTAHSSSLTAHCSLPTAHCSLLTAHCSLLTAKSSQLTTNGSVLSGSATEHKHTPLPNAHVTEASAIRRITPIIGTQGADHLLTILRSIPQGNSLLHGDLHPRNIMIADGKLVIIDMSEVGYGNPLIDMAHVHALMTSGLIDIDHFMGFPAHYAKTLWHTVLNNYYSTVSPDEYRHIIQTLDTISLIRCFTWLAVSDGLPQEVITRFQHHFQDYVEDRWQEISLTILS